VANNSNSHQITKTPNITKYYNQLLYFKVNFMKRFFFFLFLTLTVNLFCQQKQAVQTYDSTKMQWFVDAKLGIFIHFGIYAVNGTMESWPIYNNEIPYQEYMDQAKGFTASKYNPDDWAKLFTEAGARYAVLTAKHCDGFALWDTKWNKLSSVKGSPAKKELITPYAKAMRNAGLKAGIYYSHIDWSHPDYATVFDGKDPNPKNPNPWDYPKSGIADTVRWNSYLKFRDGQIKEIQELVNPDLWWFDADWSRTAAQWKMKELRQSILSYNPNTILNSRMSGYGDYVTPEQGLPITGPEGPWELCMTINDSWGYRQSDTNQKSTDYIIRVFSEVIGMGGNLLLDVGPKEDGTITPEQTRILKELGRWTKKHAEAIYGSRRGMPLGHFYGPSTLSKDGKTLYCFELDNPKAEVVVKGIKNKIKQIRVVGSNQVLIYKLNGGATWLGIPPVLLIDLPADQLDKNATVIAIELDSPLELYQGQGGAVEKN
jgi:alpha-L-fucosidase